MNRSLFRPFYLAALLFPCLIYAAPTYARSSGQDSLFLYGRIVPRDTLQTELNSFLRLGFERLERNDPESARKAFEKALQINSRDEKVYIGIGRCYLNQRVRRPRLFEMVERIFDMDNISKSIDNFQKAVDLTPESAEAHYWLGSALMKRHGRGDLEQALAQLQKASDLGGITRDLALKLALVSKALGNLDSAEKILSEVVESDEGRIDPQAGLELAKINISRHHYEKALRYYWRGLQDIKTRDEFKAYWNDVVMIADEDEKELFALTPTDSAAQFFREFWLKRDFELDLSPGMRLLRHYYRLVVADSLYRVPFARRNPSLGPLAATYPDVNIPYDDRGLVFIRHGKPDRVVNRVGEGMLPNESWVYYRPGGRDLVLHFVGLNGNQEYQLVNALSNALGRVDDFEIDQEGNIYPRDSEEATRLAWLQDLYGSRVEIERGLYYRLLNHPGDPFVLMEEQAQNSLYIRRALSSESVEVPYSHHLESYYDLVGFRGSRKDGRSTLEFYLGVPGRDITYLQKPDGYYYDIAFDLLVYDSRWNQVGHLNKVGQHKSAFNPHDLMDRQVLDLGNLDLPPGNYRYFAKVQNVEAVGLYNGSLHLDSFSSDSLQSSQILTARDIFVSPADSSKFRRYGLEIYPNPSKTFHPSDKMYAYQEIYNLTPDSSGSCSYHVTYMISVIKRDHNMFGAIYDTFKSLLGAGPGEEKVVLEVSKSNVQMKSDMVQEQVAIDISDNPDGIYELSVRVEDLNRGGRRTQRNTRFVVKR